jgi:hypothetical protein
MELINAIIKELKESTDNAVLVDFLDEGDVGNLIGIAIAKKLDKDAIRSFLHGVEHGISLINGSHDSDDVEHLGITLEVESPELRKRAAERLKMLNFGG